MKQSAIQILIDWFTEIQQGGSPAIPYNLHPLIRCLHHSLGTSEVITMLIQLQEKYEK